MSFYIFSTGSLGDADQMNASFRHVWQGTRLPRDGASLTAADSTYNIGSDEYRWNEVYANNIVVTGSITTDNMFSLKAYVELTATASSIEFTGLNGDSLEKIMIDMNTMSLTGDVVHEFNVNFNGDSTSSYSVFRLYVRTTDFLGSYGLYTAMNIVGHKNSTRMLWNLSKNTTDVHQSMFWNDTTTSISIFQHKCLWKSGTTITSIKFLSFDIDGATSASHFEPKTKLRLYGMN